MQSYLIFINSLLALTLFGGVALGTYLTTSCWYIYVLFALPMVTVVLARWMIGIEFSRPEYKSPDLRSPIQINKAFNSIVDARRKQLIRARSWVATTVSMFILCVPLGVFLFNKDKAEKEAKKQQPIPEYVYVDNQDKAIVVKAKLPNVTDLQIHLIGLNPTTKKMDTIVSHVYKNEKGELIASYYKKRLSITVSKVNLTYPKADHLETYQFMIGKEAKKEDKDDRQGKISNEDILKNQKKI